MACEKDHGNLDDSVIDREFKCAACREKIQEEKEKKKPKRQKDSTAKKRRQQEDDSAGSSQGSTPSSQNLDAKEQLNVSISQEGSLSSKKEQKKKSEVLPKETKVELMQVE